MSKQYPQRLCFHLSDAHHEWLNNQTVEGADGSSWRVTAAEVLRRLVQAEIDRRKKLGNRVMEEG